MASVLNITADTAGVARVLERLAPLGSRTNSAAALVLNRLSTKAKARVIPALTQQTGLNKRIIARAVRVIRASPQSLRAALVSRGGPVSYRYFSAREAEGGVTANVAGRTVFIPGAFRRSGRAPNRFVVRRLKSQVYLNPSRAWSGEIEKQNTDVVIPEEMVAGATRRAFEQVVESEAGAEIARELGKLIR